MVTATGGAAVSSVAVRDGSSARASVAISMPPAATQPPVNAVVCRKRRRVHSVSVMTAPEAWPGARHDAQAAARSLPRLTADRRVRRVLRRRCEGMEHPDATSGAPVLDRDQRTVWSRRDSVRDYALAAVR